METTLEAQDYLTNLWARVRAKLERDDLKYYGLRMVEPQHDATPHWHLLLFIPPDQQKQVTNILKHYSLLADPDESGAKTHRFTAKLIDRNKGSATGYVAKYISKNIDGHGIKTDRYDTPAIEAAERVTVWASNWGIRQFQFVGGPPVSIWRELRRLSPSDFNGVLNQAVEAADTGNWEAFVNLMGGPTATRQSHPLSLFTTPSDKPNRYEETAQPKITGARCGDELALSRQHIWTIENCETVSKNLAGQQGR